MTIPRPGITTKQWNRIKHFLTIHASLRGRKPIRDRAKFNGILWILRTGAPWRDLPSSFGHWSTVYSRFRLWSARQSWQRSLRFLRKGVDWSANQVDATIVRVHQHACGARIWGPNDTVRLNYDMAIGKSKGGWTTKVIIKTDALGRPLHIVLAPGNRHESLYFEEAMNGGVEYSGRRGRPRSRANCVIADRGFSSHRIRLYLRRKAIGCVIPKRSNERKRGPFNRERYKERNRIERRIGMFKQSRRLATRYDKLSDTYLAFWLIASIFMWL